MKDKENYRAERRNKNMEEREMLAEPRLERYNLRERLNLYAAPLIGALAPIAFTRYTIFRDMGYTPTSEMQHPIMEAYAWFASTTTCCFPLSLAGLIAGIVSGKITANDLVRRRLEKKTR